jgi:hypothetical protein
VCKWEITKNVGKDGGREKRGVWARYGRRGSR